MKEQYELLIIDIIQFTEDDVIITSGEENELPEDEGTP